MRELNPNLNRHAKGGRKLNLSMKLCACEQAGKESGGGAEGEGEDLADLRASIAGIFGFSLRRARGKERGVKNGGEGGGLRELLWE